MKSLATALIWLLLVAAAPVRAADPAQAQSFIEGLGQRAVEILNEPDLDADRAVAQFRTLFRESFDIPTIGRFVLGRYWRTASREQQQEYLELFENMVVETYARRFTEYSGETFRVLGSRGEGEGDTMVQSQIVRPAGPPIQVAWRVRERNGQFRIIDVSIEGVSMAVTQRNEFGAVIQRNGGRIEPLLETLRGRITAARQG
jgi:phospholipid transport system substrate-binding protein